MWFAVHGLDNLMKTSINIYKIKGAIKGRYTLPSRKKLIIYSSKAEVFKWCTYNFVYLQCNTVFLQIIPTCN